MASEDTLKAIGILTVVIETTPKIYTKKALDGFILERDRLIQLYLKDLPNPICQ